MNTVHKSLYKHFLVFNGLLAGCREHLHMVLEYPPNTNGDTMLGGWQIHPRIIRSVDLGAEFLYKYAILTQE
jgi:hypothetical protein